MAAEVVVGKTEASAADDINNDDDDKFNSSTYNMKDRKENWKRTLSLAFQSLGVIYGDIGTSPLYVYASTFPDGIKDTEDVIGVLSLIIYSILLLPLLKYVFIVLRANDNGDGGMFALYSLICRYAKVSLIPNEQPEDRELSNYSLVDSTPSTQLKRAHKIKHKLEHSFIAHLMLFLLTILGTSMVIGDGILTPCISVLSAVSGIQSLSKDTVVGVSIAILVILFCIQRFRTDKVGYSFAPVIVLWFLFINGIGLHNLFKYEVGILLAFNPAYIIHFFKRNGKKGWISLGGVVLCITGIAVVAVMVITTCMVNLIMLVIWKTSIWWILWIASFFMVFGATEAVYLSSVLYKFKQGGFLPLAFSLVLMTVMGIWHYVHKQRYCLSSITRYGYKDNIEESKEFELQLVEYLKEFIKHEHFNLEGNNERDEQQEAVLNIQTSTLLVQDQKDDLDKNATGGRSRPSSSSVVRSHRGVTAAAAKDLSISIIACFIKKERPIARISPGINHVYNAPKAVAKPSQINTPSVQKIGTSGYFEARVDISTD
ncbi:hypothetical protein LguiB_005437 [Lonicera macranthoides]